MLQHLHTYTPASSSVIHFPIRSSSPLPVCLCAPCASMAHTTCRFRHALAVSKPPPPAHPGTFSRSVSCAVTSRHRHTTRNQHALQPPPPLIRQPLNGIQIGIHGYGISACDRRRIPTGRCGLWHLHDQPLLQESVIGGTCYYKCNDNEDTASTSDRSADDATVVIATRGRREIRRGRRGRGRRGRVFLRGRRWRRRWWSGWRWFGRWWFGRRCFGRW